MATQIKQATDTQIDRFESHSQPDENVSNSTYPIRDSSTVEVRAPENEAPTKALQGSQEGSRCKFQPGINQLNWDVEVSPMMELSNQPVAKGDRLKQLQDFSLRQITRKSAARKTKDTNSTVSIRDLDLARTPVNACDPKSSARTWAQDSPVHDGEYGEEGRIPLSLQKELSVATQIPSTRASNLQTATQTQQNSTVTRRSKWAVKDEMKAEKAETDSDGWGSAAPSDETKASKGISDESLGKLLRNREPAANEPIYDWEGNWMPPPADWADRSRYNNNNPEFKTQFKEFIRDLQGRFSNGLLISVVPHTLLQDKNSFPDGIGMVHRSETISIKNAEYYGYTLDPIDAVKYARPIEDCEYEAVWKIDRNNELNAHFDHNETTNSLVANWNKHVANSRGEPIKSGAESKKFAPIEDHNKTSEAEFTPLDDEPSQDEEDEETAPLTQPALNIYLRPATRADLSELTRIYNWYISNSSQPAELREIDESEMQSRMSFCGTSRLPFIVAACKSQKGARPIPHLDDEEISRRCRLPVTHKQHVTLTRIENLAGFCCANDFTQPDFVEHIAADIELYVDAQYRRQGVGKCLMDKMLEICDRSHRLTMDVPFHCDQEVRHRYGPGGQRDLHKMSILLRKWHSPRAVTINVNGKRKAKKLAFAKSQENDYAGWMKAWLESVGFEEEGYLTRMGAKNGR